MLAWIGFFSASRSVSHLSFQCAIPCMDPFPLLPVWPIRVCAQVYVRTKTQWSCVWWGMRRECTKSEKLCDGQVNKLHYEAFVQGAVALCDSLCDSYPLLFESPLLPPFCLCRVSLLSVSYTPFVCVLYLLLFVSYTPFICVVFVSGVAHPGFRYVCHDSFICVPWLIYMCSWVE